MNVLKRGYKKYEEYPKPAFIFDIVRLGNII